MIYLLIFIYFNYPQNAINFSNLNSGVYIVKIKMADGKEFSERIVKE